MGFNASPSITAAKELISPERGESKQNSKIERRAAASEIAPLHIGTQKNDAFGYNQKWIWKRTITSLPPMIMSGLSPCSGSPVLTKNPVSVLIGPDFCGGWEGGVGAIFLRNEVVLITKTRKRKESCNYDKLFSTHLTLWIKKKKSKKFSFRKKNQSKEITEKIEVIEIILLKIILTS